MLCLEKAGGYRDNKGNNGPPEQGVTCYCFGLLLSTSGAVSGIFGRGTDDQSAQPLRYLHSDAVG